MVRSLLDRAFWGGLYTLQALLLWFVRRTPLIYSFTAESKLSELVEQYRREMRIRGGRCYIIGKGPSLDWVSTGDLEDGLRLCINNSFVAISNPDLVFIHDDHMLAFAPDIFATGAKLVIPNDLNLTSGRRLLVEEFKKHKFDDKCFYYLCRKFHPLRGGNLDDNSLWTMSGTVHSAISFAEKIGAKQICFVGIDGGGYDDRYFAANFDQNKCSFRHRMIYRKIRFDCAVLCRYLGIDYSFMGDEHR